MKEKIEDNVEKVMNRKEEGNEIIEDIKRIEEKVVVLDEVEKGKKREKGKRIEEEGVEILNEIIEDVGKLKGGKERRNGV